MEKRLEDILGPTLMQFIEFLLQKKDDDLYEKSHEDIKIEIDLLGDKKEQYPNARDPVVPIGMV